MINILQRIKNKKLFSNILNVIALSFVFIGGIFSETTRYEEIADYATQVVNNNTENKKYCAITVSKGKESNDIYSADSEFHNLYGVFRQEKITFASAINADKKHNISIENIDGNMSFLYLGAFGSYEYKGHYRHNTFPIEFMFNETDTYKIGRYHVYLSQKQANQYLISTIGERKNGFSSDDYQSLITKQIPINIDGQSFDFVIQNIFFNKNYYYEGLTDVMNDFVCINYYLPLNLRNEQQNIYFMSEYIYQNKYFMKYISEAYNSKNYVVNVLHNNIVGEINDDYLLSFYYSTSISQYEWLSILFIGLGIILLTISLFVVFNINLEKNFKNKDFVLQISLLFVPYLLFYLLSKILSNSFLLSEISTKVNGISIFVYFLICLIIKFFLNNKKLFMKNKRGSFYEINI